MFLLQLQQIYDILFSMKNYNDISEFMTEFETKCSIVKKKSFRKGEQILSYSETSDLLCFLVSGSANLIKYDYDGNKFVTERLYKNSIFSNIFYQFNSDIEHVVEAREKCIVLFFPYKYFYGKCEANCNFHKNLLEVFPKLVVYKMESLTSRLEILSLTSTREKLLNYFNILSKQHGKSFELPFSITELANYLAVDRSSMSRELSKLKKENIIKQDRNKITLLY